MSSQPVSVSSPGPLNLVRKCLGKNKTSECLQNAEHNNTRWECNFETQNREEFFKHLKNILKRVKWRDLVEAIKPDKDGWYRCVYYSTDRHHVENHYHKGSSDSMSPSPQTVMRYKNYYLGQKGKRDLDDEGDETPEYAAREMKKLKQDASLLTGFFQEQHGMHDPNGEGRETPVVPDTMKVEELMEIIEKKLELAHEMVLAATEKLQKQGYNIVSGLKTLNKEGWDKLELPLAVEEEIKNQVTSSAFNSWYGIPFAWTFHQGGYWPQYAPSANGQPMAYYPYPTNFENQESVLGVGEVKDKTEETENPTTQLVALVNPEEKKDSVDLKEQLPPLETISNIKADAK